MADVEEKNMQEKINKKTKKNNSRKHQDSNNWTWN